MTLYNILLAEHSQQFTVLFLSFIRLQALLLHEFMCFPVLVLSCDVVVFPVAGLSVKLAKGRVAMALAKRKPHKQQQLLARKHKPGRPKGFSKKQKAAAQAFWARVRTRLPSITSGVI